MSRYMTPLGKAQELEAWAKAKAERVQHPPVGFTGGHGWPDPEIYSLVDRLNQLSHVCTLQSCAGHRCTTEDCCEYCSNTGDPWKGTEHVWNGQLWLWLDERLSRWMHHHAIGLATSTNIEKVSCLYHVEGREIWDIQFRGAGHGVLPLTEEVLVKFFIEGNRICNLG